MAPRTMGSLIDAISGNYKAGISSERLSSLEVELLEQVINNKRCKKTKPTNNIVQLQTKRPLESHEILPYARAYGLDALVGKEVRIKIKVGE